MHHQQKKHVSKMQPAEGKLEKELCPDDNSDHYIGCSTEDIEKYNQGQGEEGLLPITQNASSVQAESEDWRTQGETRSPASDPLACDTPSKEETHVIEQKVEIKKGEEELLTVTQDASSVQAESEDWRTQGDTSLASDPVACDTPSKEETHVIEQKVEIKKEEIEIKEDLYEISNGSLCQDEKKCDIKVEDYDEFKEHSMCVLDQVEPLKKSPLSLQKTIKKEEYIDEEVNYKDNIQEFLDSGFLKDEKKTDLKEEVGVDIKNNAKCVFNLVANSKRSPLTNDLSKIKLSNPEVWKSLKDFSVKVKKDPKLVKMVVSLGQLQVEEKSSSNVFHVCNVCGECFRSKSQLADHQRSHSAEQQLTCVFCDESFTTRELLTNHLPCHRQSSTTDSQSHQHHTGQQTFQCAVCSKVYSSRNSLNRHFYNIHSLEKPFQCKICNKKFGLKSSFSTHLKQHSQENVKCTVCDALFDNRRKLTYHLYRCHGKNRIFKCSNCCKYFASNSLLITHQCCHSTVKKYQSKICQKYFDNSHSWNLHETSANAKDKQFSCKECNQKFSLKSYLNLHVKKSSRENSYMCSYCDEKFTMKCALRKHCSELHSEFVRKVKCPVCDKRFLCQSRLRYHQAIHGGEKPFPCNDCDKAFVNQAQLNDHKKLHMNDRGFKCTHCCKVFSIKTNLINHMQTHSEDKPFGCKFCDKSFKSKYNMQKHEECHTLKLPCDICNKVFNTKSSLVQHCKRMHSEHKSQYKCDICGKVHSLKSNLMRHIKLHNNPRPYKCTVCGAEYTTRTDLKQHVGVHDKDKLYKCSTCGKTFMWKRYYVKHLKSHKKFDLDTTL